VTHSALAKLQGTWQQTHLEENGVLNPVDNYGAELQTTIEGHQFTVTRADGSVVIKGHFSIDPSKNPAWIDWTDTLGEDAGKTFPAIYTIDADQFVFVAADEGMTRPQEFSTRPGDTLRRFQRIKSA